MCIFKNTILRRITTLALLLALVAGMATSMGKKADAAGGWTVTFTYYNGQPNETRKNIPTNATISLPTPNATANATFIGWKCGNTVYSAKQIVKVTNNMNFVGVWQVLVNFYSYNGVQIDQRSERTGYAYSLPTAPKRTGYTFAGWYTSAGERIDDTICTKAYKHDVTARYRHEMLPDSTVEMFLRGCADPLNVLNDTTSYNRGGGYIFQCTNAISGDGMCTPCAIANLLNRKLVRDTKTAAYRFDFEKDVIPVMYNIEASQGRLKYISGIKYEFDVSPNYTEKSGLVFTNSTKGSGKFLKSYTLTKVDASGDKNAQLRNLLIQHPEGVVMHAGGHAVVITGFTSDLSGNYTYYAIDTGSNLVNGNYKYTGKFEFNGNHNLKYTFLNIKLGKYSKGTDIVAKAGCFFYFN